MINLEDLKSETIVTWRNQQQLVIDGYLRSHRGHIFLLIQGCTFALDNINKYFFRICPWAPYITIELEELTV
jgi:hypothetical protein